MKKQPKTDLKALDKLTGAEITRRARSDPDNLPLDKEFFDIAKRIKLEDLLSEPKQQVTLRLDAVSCIGSNARARGIRRALMLL